MTIGEAREVLGDVRAYLSSRASLENEMLAGHTFTDICNAIKTLEQKPCGDYVSREDVMKCFKKWQPYMATRLWDYEQELRDLPSVIPSYNSIKTELEPCDDCISREEVMHILKTLYEFDELKDLKAKQREVMNLPSVTLRVESEDKE